MNYFKNLLLLSIVLFAFSCSDDDDSVSCEFLSQNIQGEVEGTAWAFQGGKVELQSDGITYDVDMYGMDEDLSGGVCNIFLGSTDQIFFSSLTAEIGEYALSTDFTNGLTVTFYDADDNLNVIATEGCINITSITADMVNIQFDVKADDDNQIKGTANFDICS